MHQGHCSIDRNELEKAMRNFVQKSSCLAALAIALAASACGPTNGPEVIADGKGGTTTRVDTASVQVAENRAADAEARAAAAEAKIQCERDRQAASNRGAVVGGVTGAIVGSQVAGDGAKSEGGAIGAVGGILAGRQIAKKDHRC
jgi:hypothetical protein